MYGTFDTENPWGKTMIKNLGLTTPSQDLERLRGIVTGHPHRPGECSLLIVFCLWWEKKTCSCAMFKLGSYWAHRQNHSQQHSLRRRTLWTLCSLAPASRNMKLVLLAFNRVGPCKWWNVVFLNPYSGIRDTSAVSSRKNGASLQESLKGILGPRRMVRNGTLLRSCWSTQQVWRAPGHGWCVMRLRYAPGVRRQNRSHA